MLPVYVGERIDGLARFHADRGAPRCYRAAFASRRKAVGAALRAAARLQFKMMWEEEAMNAARASDLTVLKMVALILADELQGRSSADVHAKRLELEEKVGPFVSENSVLRANARCIEIISDTMDLSLEFAGDIVEGHTKNGVEGVADALKGFSRELKEEMARALMRIVDDGDNAPG
jgi:hypothetical protein